MLNVEQTKSQTILRERVKQAVRPLTVAELEAVSGAGTPGAPQPDTCGCNAGTGAGVIGAGTVVAGGGK